MIDRILFYLLLLALSLIILYLLKQDLNKTLWLMIFFLIFFKKAYHFEINYYGNYFYSILDSSLAKFKTDLFNPHLYLAFFDPLIFILIYLLKTRTNFKNKFWKPGIIDFLIFLLFISSLIATFFTDISLFAWFYLWIFFKYLLLFYLSFIFSKDVKIRRIVLETLFIYAIIGGVTMFLQKISGGNLGMVVDTGLPARFSTDNPEFYRPGGLFWDANLSSSILMFFGSLASFLYLKNHNVVDRKLLFFTIIASIAGIILSLSRGVWLVLLFNFLFLLPLMKKYVKKSLKKNKFKFIFSRNFLFILIIIMIITFGFSSRFLSEHFLNLFRNFNHSTILSRIRQFEMSWVYMMQKPLGLGHNVFKYSIIHDFPPDLFFRNPASVHNLLFEVLNAIGAFGLMVFIGLILVFAKYFFKERRKKRQDVELLALLLAAFNYILVAQFYPWLYEFQITAFFWIIIGMAYAKIQEKNY